MLGYILIEALFRELRLPAKLGNKTNNEIKQQQKTFVQQNLNHKKQWDLFQLSQVGS